MWNVRRPPPCLRWLLPKTWPTSSTPRARPVFRRGSRCSTLPQST